MKLIFGAFRSIILLTLAFALFSSHAAGPSMAQSHIFSLLNNSHPVTGQPVFVADGIDGPSLNAYLEKFSAEYSTLDETQQRSVGGQYLERILTLPFRVGWQAAHYLPIIYLTADPSAHSARPRIHIPRETARNVVFKFIIEHFEGLTTADGAFAVNRPHLQTVVEQLLLPGTVADLLSSEKQIGAWQAKLKKANVSPNDFLTFVIELGLDIATEDAEFLRDPEVKKSIHHLAHSPESHGHERAEEVHEDREALLKGLECQAELMKSFLSRRSGQ